MFAATIAGAALQTRALTKAGALAAFAVGTLTHGSGGSAFTLVLLAFFGPSVALSRIGRASKRQLVDIGKGGARDASQVFANGGVATVCAVFAARSRGARAARWTAAFAGAYAAATADTWGTEIGTLMQHAPRSIFTLQPIATGLSGGVTLPGSLAEVAGAVWIAGATIAALRFVARDDLDDRANADAAREGRRSSRPLRLALTLTVAGIAGALIDSAAGASLQELRRCPNCERACETNPHACGAPTVLVRGVRGFSNDLVNALATLAGAAAAFALAPAMRRSPPA